MKRALVLALPVFLFSGEYEIEFYKDITLLHQNLKPQKPSISVNVPEYININNIQVVTDCEIQSMNLSSPKPIENDKFIKSKEIMEKIDTMQAESNALSIQLRVIQNRTNSDEAFINKSYDMSFEIFKRSKEIENKIENLKDELRQIRIDNVSNLDIKFACEPKNVKISYPVNLDLDLKTDINANLNTNKVKITRNLSITNSFFKDFKDLSINIYPIYYSSTVAPIEFSKIYEDDNTPMLRSSKMFYESPVATTMEASKNIMHSPRPVKTNFLNAWNINGVNINTAEHRLFLYDEQELDAKFDILIDGYSGSNAFIRAKLTAKHDINGDASFSVDGTRVSQSSYVDITSGKESELFFGKNMLVTVKKDVVEKYNEVSFFGNSKKTSRLWEYSIENNSNKELSVYLVERLPLSASSSIKVALMEQTSKGYKLDSKSGKVEFELKLKPKESQKISFGYNTTQPN